MLKDMGDNQATTLVNNEVMVRREAFPRPSEDPVSPPLPSPGIAHQDIDTVEVHRELYDQGQTKSLRTDYINFRTLRLLWKWKLKRVTALKR